MIQIISMQGLGDNIYQRPIVAELSKTTPVEINTSWPQLYRDLPNVTCVMDEPTILRTQLKNINKNKHLFSRPSPNPDIRFQLKYNHRSGGTLYEELLASCPFSYRFKTGRLSLPIFYLSHQVAHILSGDKPIAIIRPGTIRTEWKATARNALPEYLCMASKLLMDLGWRVVVVADLSPGREELIGNMPDCHEAYLQGQLEFEELMTVCIGADLIVGEVGWAVPFSYAANQNAIIINGGALGFNAPELLTPPQHQNDTNVQYMVPDHPCRCKHSQHRCKEGSKTISNFEDLFCVNVERLGKWQKS